MFRFWNTELRGSDQTVDSLSELSDGYLLPDAATSLSSRSTPDRPVSKRGWDAFQNSDDAAVDNLALKRTKLGLESLKGTPSSNGSTASLGQDRTERARDIIRHQIGLEVLLKHDELRLINQELAKCQVALEQLRRCHLIPYPQHCPTPDQMLDISGGKGPAVIARFGEPLPHWAPPFGVVDGPYARHYAKWLIPDPAFDGELADWQPTPDFTRGRSSFMEGRTTRNSFTETSLMSRGRPVRGNAGQKLQALSNGYPQPKDKAGPCILKRSDGQTVKLVCLDCNRENFSSTQGFINHCRIAHKRDFKSHEEAAVQSGQPIEAGDNNFTGIGNGAASASAPALAGVESKVPTTAPVVMQGNNACGSSFVHPFARKDMSEQDAYAALRSRIADSLKLYHQGKLPGVSAIPSSSTGAQALAAKKPKAVAAGIDHASETPYLSRLMQSRNFSGNLRDVVADAKTMISLDDITPDEESDDGGSPTPVTDGCKDAPVRTPVVKRVPAQSSKASAANDSPSRPASSKSRAPPLSLVSPPESTMGPISKCTSAEIMSDEDDDMEEANLSPNTLASNIAPSLVSDDGEYDDSDDGSSMSGGGDELDAESVSDVAEITLDDEQDARALRRGSSGVSGTVRLRKDDAKKQHVTFLGPVKNSSKDKRSRRN